MLVLRAVGADDWDSSQHIGHLAREFKTRTGRCRLEEPVLGRGKEFQPPGHSYDCRVGSTYLVHLSGFVVQNDKTTFSASVLLAVLKPVVYIDFISYNDDVSCW